MSARGARTAALLAVLSLAGAAGGSTSGCARATPHRPPPRTQARAPDRTWRYEVAIGEAGRDLTVEAHFDAGAARAASVAEGAERFVDRLEVDAGDGAFRPLAREGDRWLLPACARECRARYVFHLRDAAEALDDDDVATSLRGLFEAPFGTWLLHPLEAWPDEKLRVHVASAPAGVTFATSVPRARDGAAATWEADALDIGDAPYTVIGAARVIDVALARAHLTLAVAPGKLALDDAHVAAWIEHAGRAVEAFYGRFPMDGALFVVVPRRGDRVGFGRTLAGAGGGSTILDVGAEAGQGALDRDWVAVHEMTHLAFPSVPRESRWIEEGLATYLEPIERARAGLLPEDEVWRGLVEGLPNGLPRAGDRGLDHTPTWGRIYWGGALFCLLADLEIRERTHGARGLPDAVRGILAAGANDAQRWPLERALDAGDRATGVPVLRELHRRMGSAPYPVDLEALFRDLGVTVRGDSVTYDDGARLAPLRRALVQGGPDGTERAQGMLAPRP